MKRWTALVDGQNNRWTLMSQLIERAGCPNEFVPWDTDRSDLSLLSLKDFSHVRVDSGAAQWLMKNLKVRSSWTTLLGMMDGMYQVKGSWWPLCALYESFNQVAIRLGKNIDTRGRVFIAGAGGAARVAVASFFKSGFQSFLLTNSSEEQAVDLIREIKARFFGLEIEWVPLSKIVLLPGDSSILCNCTPAIEGNVLLTELAYLNFLRRPGFVFDLNLTAQPSVLVVEAKDAGVVAVTGLEFAARSDVQWAKWAFQVDLKLEDYQAELIKTLV